MTLLAFDTSFQACSVAVGPTPGNGDDVQPDVQPVAHSFEAREKGHAEILMPMIEQVLQSAGVLASELTKVAVTYGPGSFTGTRTTVAAARGFSLALQVPLEAATSLRVMGFGARRRLIERHGEGANGQPLVITVDARRGAVYTLVCPPNEIGEDAAVVLLPITEAAALAKSFASDTVLFVGTGADAVCAEARANQIEADVFLPDLQPDARDLWQLSALGLLEKSEPINPLYLRPADAKPQVGKAIARA